MADPGRLLELLADRDWTVAVAESLTGGLVCSTLVDVPGASEVLRGGVVSYATDLKASLLGVDEALLAAGGPVQADVAEQMAVGVAERLDASCGLATTGVAGPGAQDGVEAGTVFVAVAVPGGQVTVRGLNLPGDRAAVRVGAAIAVLGLAVEVLGKLSD